MQSIGATFRTASLEVVVVVLVLVVVVVLQTAQDSLAQSQQPQSSSRFGRSQRQLAATLLKPKLNNSTVTTTNAPKIESERSIPSNSGSARLESFVEDELPPDFYEMPPEQLDLGMNATGRAPTPVLNVEVHQNGQKIDSAITVHPGTPLEMIIYLDEKSADVYGILASSLKVQDDTQRGREEVIITNGCSIDTYIFGNFEHNSEDKTLRAKFRAFKFPDSNLVRFVGTVNVCIKQCAKVNCNGANSVSRRKRGAANNERLVQLTVSTVLRIGKNRNSIR